MSDPSTIPPPGDPWRAADWRAFEAELRRAAQALEGDAAAVARVRARLEAEVESGSAAGEPLLAAWPVWRERLGRSVLLRLLAASVLLHVLALPVLAYLWWRPERPPPALGFLPISAEAPPEFSEPELGPELLPAAPVHPDLELDRLEALETRLRLDRFRRAQLEPAPRAASGSSADPLESGLAALAARRLGLSDLLPEGLPGVRSGPLAWARWSLAVQLDLDAYADLSRAPAEVDQRSLEALGQAIREALAAPPSSEAELSAAQRGWRDDVLQRAIDFGLLEGAPDERAFPGDPRRWLSHALACLPAQAALSSPWREWADWAAAR